MKWYMLFLFPLLIPLSLSAQNELYNNGGIISVKPGGGLIHVNGEVVNDAGQLENAGKIEVAKDWTNNGSFVSDGTVEFYGNDTSRLAGNMTTSNAFHHLIINKTAGIPVILENDADVDIAGTLDLQSGYIVTGSYRMYLTNNAPNAITGHSQAGSAVDDRYIHGNLRREVGQLNVDYDFPVGGDPSGMGYQFARLNFNSAAGVNYIDAYFDEVATTPPMVNKCDYFYDCSLTGHGVWDLQPDAGKSFYTLSVMPRNYTAACGPNRSYTTMRDSLMDADSCATFLGFPDATNGSLLTQEGYGNNFLGRFAVVSGSENVVANCGRDDFEPNDIAANAAPLPWVGVNLNAQICASGDEDWYTFTVGNKNNIAVKLTSLGTEIDMYLYDDNLNIVDSSVNASNNDELVLINNATLGGMYYVRVFGRNGAFMNDGYRLIVQRNNTPITLAAITRDSASRPTPEPTSLISQVEVSRPTGVEEPVSSLNLYPNPASYDVRIAFTSSVDGACEVRIKDLRGRPVHYLTQRITKGYNRMNFSVDDFAEGLYLVEFQMGNYKEVKKLEVIR